MRYDTQLLAEDMAVKGWNKVTLAQRAGVADLTVIRFLSGERQTARTARALAKALGHSARRYLVRASEAA